MKQRQRDYCWHAVIVLLCIATALATAATNEAACRAASCPSLEKLYLEIGRDILRWFSGKTALTDIVGSRIHQNVAPEGFDGVYLWFGRATTERERSLDDQPGTIPFSQSFDVEAISDDIDEVMDLIEQLHLLDSTTGTFGNGTVQAVFFNEHSDDYIPRGVLNDEGMHVAAIEMQIVGYAE